MKIHNRMILIAGVIVIAMAAIVASNPLAAINAVTTSSTYALREAVPYGVQPRQKLDIFTPTGSAPAGGWPVVLFLYGGSWVSGERSSYHFLGEALASRGVLTLVADYRLYPEVRYPDFLVDCAHALAFGLEQAPSLGGNPKRVFVMGHSAGAYNAAMLALDPRWLAQTGHVPGELAGWIGLAGPYDFLPITNLDAQPVFFHPNYPAGTQPLTYAAGSSLPAFLGAAVNDNLVNPTRNTLRLAKSLQAAHVAVSLHEYTGVNHVTLMGALSRPLRWLAPVLDDVIDFIDQGR